MSPVENFIKFNMVVQNLDFKPNLESWEQNLQNLEHTPVISRNCSRIWGLNRVWEVGNRICRIWNINPSNINMLARNPDSKAESGTQQILEFLVAPKTIKISMLPPFLDFVAKIQRNLGFCIINQYLIYISRYDIKHPIPIGIGSHHKVGFYSIPRDRVSFGGSYSPTILSLDLGTLTGWATRNNHGHIISGTASFKPSRFDGGGMRYLRFTQWLNETHSTVGHIDAVYFEEVRRHLGVDAAHAYGGFLAHLTAWCEQHSIPYQGVPVGTIKHFITGKGNASKAQVISAVTALGYHPKDDNEADALALLHYAIKQHRR